MPHYCFIPVTPIPAPNCNAVWVWPWVRIQPITRALTAISLRASIAANIWLSSNHSDLESKRVSNSWYDEPRIQGKGKSQERQVWVCLHFKGDVQYTLIPYSSLLPPCRSSWWILCTKPVQKKGNVSDFGEFPVAQCFSAYNGRSGQWHTLISSWDSMFLIRLLWCQGCWSTGHTWQCSQIFGNFCAFINFRSCPPFLLTGITVMWKPNPTW